MSTDSLNINICRYCHEEDNLSHLIQPCNCKGTLAYSHLECLRKWTAETMCSYNTFPRNTNCEICHEAFSAEFLPHQPVSGLRSDGTDQSAQYSTLATICYIFALFLGGLIWVFFFAIQFEITGVSWTIHMCIILVLLAFGGCWVSLVVVLIKRVSIRVTGDWRRGLLNVLGSTKGP